MPLGYSFRFISVCCPYQWLMFLRPCLWCKICWWLLSSTFFYEPRRWGHSGMCRLHEWLDNKKSCEKECQEDQWHDFLFARSVSEFISTYINGTENEHVKENDIVDTFTSLIRQIVEYACPVWHVGLPKYLQKEVETIQKRVLTTIYGIAPYEQHLCASGLVSFKDRCVICLRKYANLTVNWTIYSTNSMNIVNPWEMPH